MKILKKFTLVFILLLSFSNLKAQTSIDKITDEFFEIYEKAPLKAIDYAFNNNKWIKSNTETIESLKTQFASTLKLLGEFYGYEEITEKTIGKNILLRSYLLKYDLQPIRFTFIFYKPNEDWRVQNFKYDDSILIELEESAKIYWLPENRW